MRNCLSFLMLLSVLVLAACGNPEAGENPAATESTEAEAQSVDAMQGHVDPVANGSPAETMVDEVTGYIDPVCNMKVSADAQWQHNHEGVNYGFCGKGCMEAFAADPETYLAALEE